MQGTTVADFTLMTFEEDGFPVEVHGADDCERAVAQGRVNADTEITVYDRDRRVRRQRAADAPVFAELFGTAVAAVPLARATPQIDEVPMPVLPPSPASPAAQSAEPAAPSTPTPDGQAQPSWDAPPPADRSVGSGGGFLPFLLVGLAMALVAAIGWIVIGPGSRSNDGNLASDTTVAKVASAAQDLSAPSEDAVPREMLYAVREVDLMQEARIGTPLGRVPRGTVLNGIPVPAAVGDDRWLKIQEGPNAGLFAWMGNLSSAGRPALDTTLAGDRTMMTAATLAAEPGAGAAEASGNDVSLAVGATVDVAGIVGDAWAEIRRSGGGVGYVPLAAIRSAEEPITEEDETAADTETTHRLRLVNRCSRPIRVGLYFRDADGWQANGGAFWSVDGGDTSVLRRDGAVISAISPEIYGTSFDASGAPIDQTGDTIEVSYGRFRARMAKLTVTLASNNDYEIAYQC